MKKQILFRPAASMMSMDEAISQVKELRSIEDILDYINLYKCKKDKATIEDLTIKFYCYDKRINWKTYLICSKGRAEVFTNGLVEGIKVVK